MKVRHAKGLIAATMRESYIDDLGTLSEAEKIDYKVPPTDINARFHVLREVLMDERY